VPGTQDKKDKQCEDAHDVRSHTNTDDSRLIIQIQLQGDLIMQMPASAVGGYSSLSSLSKLVLLCFLPPWLLKGSA